MLTGLFRILIVATATAIAIVAPKRIISKLGGIHAAKPSTPNDGSCSNVLLPKYG